MFRALSPMVSVPTSGMQLENANEIFKCLFDAVGLKPTDARMFPKQDTYSGNFGTQNLTVHIVSSEENADESSEEIARPTNPKTMWVVGSAPTALLLENLHITGHGLMISGTDHTKLQQIMPQDVKFDLSLGRVTQVVNIAIIRLFMQISETIDVVKEENKFAQKMKSLELVSSRAGMASEKSTLREYNENHKGWRTMHNVLQLYTNDEALLTSQKSAEESSPETRKFLSFFVALSIVNDNLL